MSLAVVEPCLALYVFFCHFVGVPSLVLWSSEVWRGLVWANYRIYAPCVPFISPLWLVKSKFHQCLWSVLCIYTHCTCEADVVKEQIFAKKKICHTTVVVTEKQRHCRPNSSVSSLVHSLDDRARYDPSTCCSSAASGTKRGQRQRNWLQSAIFLSKQHEKRAALPLIWLLSPAVAFSMFQKLHWTCSLPKGGWNSRPGVNQSSSIILYTHFSWRFI